jgi:hypothetical protein
LVGRVPNPALIGLQKYLFFFCFVFVCLFVFFGFVVLCYLLLYII